MATTKPRVNITFDTQTLKLLDRLAKEQHMSRSSLGKALIVEALERREDVALSSIAAKRDKKTAKRISHDDAWS